MPEARAALGAGADARLGAPADGRAADLRRLVPAALALSALLALGVGAALLAMGRNPICTCGTVRLFYPLGNGPETSQQVADWYTPSHVIHGILFYGLLAWGARRLLGASVPALLLLPLAVAVEGAWELFENTDATIEHYRTTTAATGYRGDSVLNSMSDLAAMVLGFLAAARLPARASVALVVALELAALLAVRDNLFLNVLMLLHPIEAIRAWQGGAPPAGG